VISTKGLALVKMEEWNLHRTFTATPLAALPPGAIFSKNPSHFRWHFHGKQGNRRKTNSKAVVH
jgi:hypothetical protein